MTKIVKKVIRAALYIRVSTEEQARHGYSLNSQEKRLKEYCKYKHYKIIGVYIDAGKSARSKLNQRKELLKLIDDVKDNKVDRIVFWKLDRWFRDVADYYKVQEILGKYKVDWECSDEEYNTTTSAGRLQLNVRLAIAQNESDQTSDRIKFNFKRMVKDKKAICGTHGCPLGYMVTGEKGNKHVIKNPKEEELVNYIFDTYEITNSYRKTCSMVQDRFNYYVDPLTIKRMMKKTFYYGTFRNVDNYCEPYITKERYDKIQSMLPKNVRQNKKHEYLFTGLLVCDLCGKRMASQFKEHKYYIYRCASYSNSRSCPKSNTINENRLEKYLLENIIFLKEQVIHNEQKNKKKIDYSHQQEKLNTKLKRLNELYLEDRINKEKYDTEYSDTQSKIIELSKQQREDKSIIKPKTITENMLKTYQSLDKEHKRIFWLEQIDSIRINPYHKDIKDKITIFFK